MKATTTRNKSSFFTKESTELNQEKSNIDDEKSLLSYIKHIATTPINELAGSFQPNDRSSYHLDCEKSGNNDKEITFIGDYCLQKDFCISDKSLKALIQLHKDNTRTLQLADALFKDTILTYKYLYPNASNLRKLNDYDFISSIRTFTHYYIKQYCINHDFENFHHDLKFNARIIAELINNPSKKIMSDFSYFLKANSNILLGQTEFIHQLNNLSALIQLKFNLQALDSSTTTPPKSFYCQQISELFSIAHCSGMTKEQTISFISNIHSSPNLHDLRSILNSSLFTMIIIENINRLQLRNQANNITQLFLRLHHIIEALFELDLLNTSHSISAQQSKNSFDIEFKKNRYSLHGMVSNELIYALNQCILLESGISLYHLDPPPNDHS